MRTGPKCEKWPKSDLYEATSDLEIEGQGHKTIVFVALPIYTHIPNLKGLTKIFFKLSRLKGIKVSTSYTLRFLRYSPDKLFPATRPPIRTTWVTIIPQQPLRAVG